MAGARERICETAVRLFNERGYDAVSLRDIAAEAGTTIGNLTYHFKKKENLLEAILADLYRGYSAQLNRSLAGAGLLRHLVGLFRAAERNRALYPFYYQNADEIYRASDAVRAQADEFSAHLCRYLAWGLTRLREDGYVRAACSDRALELVALAVVQLESSWMLASAPAQGGQTPQTSLTEELTTLLALCLEDERLPELPEA